MSLLLASCSRGTGTATKGDADGGMSRQTPGAAHLPGVPVGAAADRATHSADPATRVTAPAADVADAREAIGQLFDSAATALAGITSAETAKAAIPTLSDLSAKLEKLTESLPPEARSAAADLIRVRLGQLRPIALKVLLIPGVGPTILPTLRELESRLTKLAGHTGRSR